MRPTTQSASRCLRCEQEIKEPWKDPGEPICSTCALEAELFDRELRLA